MQVVGKIARAQVVPERSGGGWWLIASSPLMVHTQLADGPVSSGMRHSFSQAWRRQACRGSWCSSFFRDCLSLRVVGPSPARNGSAPPQQPTPEAGAHLRAEDVSGSSGVSGCGKETTLLSLREVLPGFATCLDRPPSSTSPRRSAIASMHDAESLIQTAIDLARAASIASLSIRWARWGSNHAACASGERDCKGSGYVKS